MAQLLTMFAFLAVLLRAATLAFQSLVIGGAAFGLFVAREKDTGSAPNGVSRLLRWSAIALAVTGMGYIAADAALLASTAGLSFGEIASANFFVAGAISIVCALLFVAIRGETWISQAVLLLAAIGILGSSVATSHAAARLDHRAILLAFTTLHQLAAATWLGGLPYLLITVRDGAGGPNMEAAASRFSRMAQASVAAIVAGGIGLAVFYVESVPALYGTSYGIMVVGKVVMLLLLVGLGGLNFLLVRSARDGRSAWLAHLRPLSEAEIGIGFTAILAAASLTSQPPAADMQQSALPVHEIAARMTPRAPRLHSPALSELSPPTPASTGTNTLESYVPGAVSHPSTPGDIAWSEYNHNWSGLVVLTMGILAVLSRVFRIKWARAWPLAFLGLALFLFFRADPEAWPLGAKGFWSSMSDPEVLQHRLFAGMIVAFAIFEWGVQTERIRSRSAALVFPGVCAAGGALLLTHSHALGSIKEEYLAELSHLPIAICAVAAGWSRWLEQRLSSAWRRIPAMIWPVCFVLIGLMLLFYREA